MTLETFFEKFGRLADAPDAITKIRELIWRLAFSGGLSGTPSTDGVPNGWAERTIESIASSLTPGFACSRNHEVVGGHVHLRTHNVSTRGTLNFDLFVRIDPKMVDPRKSSIRAGDILFNNTNSQELVGKTCLVDRDYDYGFSNHLTRIRLGPGALPSFVVFYLTFLRQSGHFARLCTRWINQAAVNTEALKEQTIPLPPLAEQERLVAKLNELMRLCDRLEEQQQEREKRHAVLARAALARFADEPTATNLDLLFNDSYSIAPADLRKTVIGLAIQGRLVRQYLSEGDSSGLLVEIEAEKRRYADRYGVRILPDEPLRAASEPFPVPASWTWCRLSALCNVVTDGDHLPPPKSDDGIAFLTIGNITTGFLDFEGCRFVPEAYFDSLAPFKRPARGDILYTVVGATYGRPALVDTDRPFCVQRHVAILKPSKCIEVRFLLAALRSSLVYEQATESITGTAQPTIPLGSLRSFIVPLPPVAEQRRIIEELDRLMVLVDQLETDGALSCVAGAELLRAVVADLSARA